LNLADNQTAKIEGFDDLISLEELNLSFNPLKSDINKMEE